MINLGHNKRLHMEYLFPVKVGYSIINFNTEKCCCINCIQEEGVCYARDVMRVTVEIVEIVRTKKNMVVQEKRKNAALGRFVQEIR